MGEKQHTGRHRLRWILLGAGVVVVGTLAWVGVRGAMTIGELRAIEAEASSLRDAVLTGDIPAAGPSVERLTQAAHTARSLTDDPIWRAYEVIPLLGGNLSAVRQVSATADDIAQHALDPLLASAGGMDLAALRRPDGSFDLDPLVRVAEPLDAADKALTAATEHVAAIDRFALLPPLDDAIDTIQSTVGDAAATIATLHGAADLLPPMLGADGPRTYIVAMQNNAETRSAGGIVGALALVQASQGSITLLQQASTPDFPPLESPLAVSAASMSLFGERPGQYVQNTTSAAEFAESGQLIAQMWQQRFGQQVDGVIAVDAVVAAHLLRATGAIEVAGTTIDADNAVDFLLSGVYQDIQDPAAQDEVFAELSTALFGKALAAPPSALLSAVTSAAAEERIRIWSAHEAEQEKLAASTLGGSLPSDALQPSVGVLVNDLTGGKMDFYATARATIATGVCEGQPITRVKVTWSNTAPADADRSLPPYVTADGHYGVPAGSTRTLLAVYGPEGATAVAFDRDGAQRTVQTALLGERPTLQHDVLLGPGESTTITVDFAGGASGDAGTILRHTPLVGDFPVETGTLTCRK